MRFSRNIGKQETFHSAHRETVGRKTGGHNHCHSPGSAALSVSFRRRTRSVQVLPRLRRLRTRPAAPHVLDRRHGPGPLARYWPRSVHGFEVPAGRIEAAVDAAGEIRSDRKTTYPFTEFFGNWTSWFRGWSGRLFASWTRYALPCARSVSHCGENWPR